MRGFDSIEEAIGEISRGKMVIVVDDEDRENEGDFIMAAEKVTPEAINFISKHARGLICVPLPKERIEELDLVPMVKVNTAKMGTRFTVSVDALENTTTGISAHDRAQTIRALIDSKTKPEDLAKPGHIFPIQAMDGGVLSRAGHTEATVDLPRMAGLYPAGVLCEIMDDDGHMARLPRLLEMAKKFNMRVVTVKDLIDHLAEEADRTIFISSHQLPLIEEVSDRIAILHEGKLLALGTRDDLLAQTKTKMLEDAFFKITGIRKREAEVLLSWRGE